MTELRVVSYSEIATARQCSLNHQLSYVERWRKPGLVGGARGIGTDWHLVMEAHYRELMRLQTEQRAVDGGPSAFAWTYPDEAAQRLWDATHGTDVFSGPNAELIAWMYKGYLDFYGLNPAWTVLGVEFQPEVDLPNPDGGESQFRLKIRADLVIQEVRTGLVWLVDHKSGTRRPDQIGLDLADQFGLYTFVLRRIGRPVHGAIHSWAKTNRLKTKDEAPVDRYALYPLDRSEVELDTIAADAYRSIARRYAQVDAGEVPDVYPDAEWCKRRCDFVNAHLASRKGIAHLQTYLRDTGHIQDFTRH